jgi:hypothetical protein
MGLQARVHPFTMTATHSPLGQFRRSRRSSTPPKPTRRTCLLSLFTSKPTMPSSWCLEALVTSMLYQQATSQKTPKRILLRPNRSEKRMLQVSLTRNHHHYHQPSATEACHLREPSPSCILPSSTVDGRTRRHDSVVGNLVQSDEEKGRNAGEDCLKASRRRICISRSQTSHGAARGVGGELLRSVGLWNHGRMMREVMVASTRLQHRPRCCSIPITHLYILYTSIRFMTPIYIGFCATVIS